MKYLALALALPLCGCTFSTSSSQNVHEQIHRTVAAGALQRVRIENVSGSITVTAGTGDTITVDATKSGSTSADLARTHVDISTSGNELSVKTDYDQSGGSWFGNRGGASVEYHLRVPARLALDVTNVSGALSITGAAGDVQASEVSGDVRASLGRVSGPRTIRITAVSGKIGVSIAKNSDVQVTAKTISGSITQFMDGTVHHGYVGADSSARLGSGSAAMNLSTVSGSISISPQ